MQKQHKTQKCLQEAEQKFTYSLTPLELFKLKVHEHNGQGSKLEKSAK